MVSDKDGVGSLLVKALIEAKKEFKPLIKNKKNPHYGNMYADLSAVHESVDEALAKHGLTVMQPMEIDSSRNHIVVTKLKHVSGEQEVSHFPLPGGVKIQELASSITYGRRYSLCAILGISADDDDDGNVAATTARKPAAAVRPAAPKDAAEPVKAEPPKAAPTKVDNHWVGSIVDVNSPKNGTWKMKGGDAEATEFGTATPEHAAVASTAKAKGVRVSIKFVTQPSNGVKRILSIEPVREEAPRE